MDADRARMFDDVQERMRALSSRDLQLWSIGLLVLLVLASGFAALVAPNLMWGDHALMVSTRYLPQLFFGFIALVILFNIYVLAQRRELNTSRQELMSELMFSQRVQNMSLLDPLTQIFNRRYLDYAIPREIALANRHGMPLAFLMFDLDGFSSLNSRFGQMTGDQLLIETAKLLGGVFGTTETLLRYGGDEFLALIPECPGEQAQERAQQVLGQVRLWNETAGKGYRMSLSYGVAEYRQGCDVKDVLAEAEAGVQRHRKQATDDRLRRLRPDCLIVSRDCDAVGVLRSTLESLSVEVETCADMAAAREMFPERRFEAVVVDADLSGAEDLLTRVRAVSSIRNPILVALGNPAASACLGANFVLEKPLATSGVTRTLRVIQTLMLAERQRYFRHPVSSPVLLRFDNNPEFEATATDLSEGGMAVRCGCSLEAGRTGTVRFQLPEMRTTLETRVQTAWSDGEGRAGLRFVEMPGPARAALERWLHDRSKNLIADSVRKDMRAENVGRKAAGKA